MCNFVFDSSLRQSAAAGAVGAAEPTGQQPPSCHGQAAIRRRLACCGLVRCSLILGAAIALAAPAAWGQSGAAMAVGNTARASMAAAADSSAEMAGSAEMDGGSPGGGTSGPFGAGLFGNLSGSAGPGGAGPGGQNRGLAIGGGDVASLAAGSLAEFFSRPLDGVAGAGQPSLREQAAVALHRGDPRLALALFHAHLVAERDAASAGHAAVRYSALLRRPVWALRLGVSLNAKVPADLIDDPQPIREGDSVGGRGEFAAGQATGPARGARRRAARSQPAELEMAMQEEMAAQEMSAEAGMGEMAMAADGEMNAAGRGMNAAQADGEDAFAAAARESEIVNEIFDRDLGLVAQVLKEELSKRIAGGSFGVVLGELTAQGGALAAEGSSASLPAAAPTSGGSVPPSWIPGVEYLGNGIAAQTLEQAQQRQLDLLLHFEVIVKETRGEENQYLARLRVVDVASGETLGASRLMNRRDVTLAARRSSVKAVVEELMQPALAAIDTKAAVVPLPQLAPAHAASRIERLLGGPQAPGIAELAEIVMFHHRGLIDEEQLEQAMFYAAGEEGLRLLYDAYEQRVALATERALSELE